MLDSFIKTPPMSNDQKEAVEKALQQEKFLLCLDTGQGKTWCALSIFDAIKRTNPNCLCLVLSTKTGLATWEREIQKHTIFTCQENLLSSDVDISILTPPHFQRMEENINEITKKFPVVLLIDECHFLKSIDSHFARVVRRNLKNFVCIYGLTASPLLNHIEDVFHLFESIFPGIFAGDYESFMNFYTNRRVREVLVKEKKVKFKEVMSYKNLEVLKSVIGKYMYRKTTSYKVEFEFCKVQSTPEELEIYTKSAHGILGDEVSPRNFVARLPQLQLAANLSIDENGDARKDWDLSTKEKRLFELVREIIGKGESVIVFTYYRITLFRLADLMRIQDLGQNMHIITGSTSAAARKHVSNTLGGGEVVLATAAGSMSINLQAANHVIFFDLPWSVGTFCQSVGRIARIDSKFEIFNVHILGALGTIDEYKLMLVSANLSLISEVIGGIKPYSALSSKITRGYIVKCRKELLWKFHKQGGQSGRQE